MSKVKIEDPGPTPRTIEKLFNLLNERLSGWTVTMKENGTISVESVTISIESEEVHVGSAGSSKTAVNPAAHKICCVSWINQDEDLGSYILGLLQSL